ncbi:MAG: AcvB/VirJ family lysyl-phosphatidylglycerol hydrolase [Gemmatimonadales bacterium]
MLRFLWLTLLPPFSRPADTLAVPVHEVPAAAPGSTLALFLSGDGGWAGFDQDVAAGLADRGIPVVGVDLRRYLQKRRSPEEAAADLGSVAAGYLARWGAHRLVVVGYSRGADIASLVVRRLADSVRVRVALVAMLGLGYHAGFHVSLFDLMRTTTSDKDFPILPELQALRAGGIPLLCVFGADEKESLCRDAPEGLMDRVRRPGGHHFDGDRAALAGVIAARAGLGP